MNCLVSRRQGDTLSGAHHQASNQNITQNWMNSRAESDENGQFHMEDNGRPCQNSQQGNTQRVKESCHQKAIKGLGVNSVWLRGQRNKTDKFVWCRPKHGQEDRAHPNIVTHIHSPPPASLDTHIPIELICHEIDYFKATKHGKNIERGADKGVI